MSIESAVVHTSTYRENRPIPTLTSCWSTFALYRWLKAIAGVGILTILLNCLAIGYGRLEPLPNGASAIGLGLCDDRPCLKSLIPGRTPWTAELAHLDTLPADPFYSYQLSLFPSLDRKWLATLGIRLSSSTTVTVGDIVQLYGVPCRVDMFDFGRSMILSYPLLDAQINLMQDRLAPDTPVYYVSLRGSADELFHAQFNPCSLELSNTFEIANILRRLPWRGFTSINRYLFP
jgi:hypothetical protein